MKAVRKAVKAAAAVSGETLVENVLTDLYEFAKQAAGDRIKLWYVKKCARKLHTHVHKIRQVKTLWQVDKAVDLKQFYCDSHLVLDNKRVIVRSIADLGERKRVLITGIAGQGKSILLRYLCSNALSAGECLPVFIELRRVLSSESLIEHIQQFLEVIGIPNLEDLLLRTLLGSGKVVLFLDGFDEVSETDKPKMVREIEHLAMAYDQLRIIVTSRPESGLEVSPLLEVIKLSDLENGEYKVVIKKLSDDTPFAENLVRQVETHISKLEDLLCTPLLVTLLVMSYKSFQELPEQLSEFYDSIFHVLLQRHDGVKPGFKRPRRCSFNDNLYRSVFESLCFESKRKIKSIFTYDDINSFAKSALQKNHLDADADKYIDDIVKVTCLILREGKDYRFIHKSVQEYYAAAFVKHRSEPVAKRFYEQMVQQGPYGGWRQELHFLSEIDRYRFNKYFDLPYLCSILGFATTNVPATVPVVDTNHAKTLFGSIRLGFGQRSGGPLSCVFMSWNSNLSPKHVDRIFRMDFSGVLKAVENGRITPDKTPVERPPGFEHDPFYVLSVGAILDAGLLHPELVKLAQEVVNDAFHYALKTIEAIVKEESVDINLQFEIE